MITVYIIAYHLNPVLHRKLFLFLFETLVEILLCFSKKARSRQSHFASHIAQARLYARSTAPWCHTGRSRWSFESMFPSFSVVFPLKFLHIDQTHILLNWNGKKTLQNNFLTNNLKSKLINRKILNGKQKGSRRFFMKNIPPVQIHHRPDMGFYGSPVNQSL